jgi:hypothetical protein
MGAGRTRLLEVALALAVFAVLGVLIEFVASAMLASRGGGSGSETEAGLYPLDEDAELGWVLRPSTTHHAVKTLADGTVCYDVTYRTDAWRRRTVLQPQRPDDPHLLLFGGSATMGEGLADQDTLQFLLAKRLPQRNVYDYAVSGYGPSHMLALLESGELPSQVESRRGNALFVMIPEHVSRVSGDTRAFWVYPGPYYSMDGAGVPVRHGSFRSGRPLTTSLYQAFLAFRRHSSFLTLIDLELPPRIPQSAVDLTASVLIRSQQLYAAQFDGSFAVVLHPSWNPRNERVARIRARLLERLGAAGVQVFDFSQPGGLLPEDVIRPGCDQHPNGRLNARLAAEIASHLPPLPPRH